MQKFKIDIQDKLLNIKGLEATINFYDALAMNKLILDNLFIFETGVDSPFFNVVIGSPSFKELDDNKVNLIKKFFEKYQVPWSWLITNNHSPEFKQNSFKVLEEYPGLYIDLTKSFPESKQNYIVKEVTGSLYDWIEPIREGFPSNDNCENFRKLNADLLAKGNKQFKHYVAFCEGSVAASGTLFFSKNSVMLHNLATKTRFRKKGIGTALTLHMLLEAKKYGFKDCFLDTSEEAFNLYYDLGFRIYCITRAYCISDN